MHNIVGIPNFVIKILGKKAVSNIIVKISEVRNICNYTFSFKFSFKFLITI